MSKLSCSAPLHGALVAALVVSLGAPARAQSTPPKAVAPSTSDATNDDPALADYQRARTLYRQAAQSFEEGHYTKARELLLEAWALRQSYDVAASLGDTEVHLGLFAEAAEHLSFSLRTFPPLENEQAIANVRRQLDVARKMTAAFRVSTDDPEAEVRVDGRLVGKTPLADPVFVAPGKHTIEAKKGFASASRTVVGTAGEEQRLDLRLAEPDPNALPSYDTTEDAAGRRSIVPLIVGGAAVAVGLTAGIAFRLSANSSDEHADEIRTRLGRSGCAGTSGQSADCATLRDDIDAANRSSALSTAGFVLAGIGLVATPVWYFLTPRQNRESGVQMSAFFTPSFSAVTASGRF